GFSTTKRYLHLGHSIFLPIWAASRMGTRVSQLGHGCLKGIVTAMLFLRQRADGEHRQCDEENHPHHKRRTGVIAKDKSIFSEDSTNPVLLSWPRRGRTT